MVSKQPARDATRRKSQLLAAQTVTPQRATGNAADHERRTQSLLKGKGKATLNEGTSPLKHSGMARIVLTMIQPPGTMKYHEISPWDR